MNKINKKLKCVTIILLCVVMLVFNINYSYATDNVKMAQTNNSIENTNINIDLEPIISSPVVDINTPVRVSFDNTDVLSYSIETDGLIAVEVTDNSMEYDLVVTEEFGVLDVYATYPGDIVVKSSVYTYKTNNKVYVSDVSKDQAWYEWIEELVVDLAEVVLSTAQEWYYELCSGYTQAYTPSTNELLTNDAISGKTVIQGKLFWQEDEYVAPLIKAKVQLIKKADGVAQIIATQYSNPDGSFRFEIDNSNWADNGEDIFVRWWLESETFKVTNNWILDTYCFQSSVKTSVPEGTVENFYYIIPKDEDNMHYKATFVHQAMTIAERFAIEMGMTIPNYGAPSETKTKLNVAFPALFVDQNSAYCLGTDYLSVASIGKTNWNDVDTMTHEYGHYAQYLKGIYGATLVEIACNGPQHHPLEDHMSDNWEKEYAMELTWSEAWASVFSILSEHYYWYKTDREYGYFDDNVSPGVKPRTDAMSGNSCLGWDFETPNNTSYNRDDDESTPGIDTRSEFQEMSVGALLWDLYDPNNEDFDSICLGYKGWWGITTQEGMYTLEDFIQYIVDSNYNDKNLIGQIMSYYKIAPEIVDISSCGKNEPPIISFVINGSQEHPNNRVKVLFYDTNGLLLEETDLEEFDISHRTTYDYVVENELWQSILEKLNYRCDETYDINIVIEGYRYDFAHISDYNRRLSGPYFSSQKQITLQANHSLRCETYDSNNHELVCDECDSAVLIKHNFEYVTVNNIKHHKFCTDCGFGMDEAHHLQYTQPDNEHHSAICLDCNASITESHNFSYQALDSIKHILTCSCGATQGNASAHVWTATDLTNTVECKHCKCIKKLGIGEFVPIIKTKIEIEEETE